MPDFHQRSYRKELLDRDDLPFRDIERNMQELDVINHRLGGHRITLEGVRALALGPHAQRPLHIVEAGCGGGDNLRVIRQWAQKKGLPVQLTGIDLNPECIAYARNHAGNTGIAFIHSDYRQAALPQKADIIFSSLFCHHFNEEELVLMLRWMQDQSVRGFFINDLHRHPLAYYPIKILTQLFSKSYLVKNDAPLSVERGFIKKDWERLFAAAGIAPFTCSWRWAFRWLITYHHAIEHGI